MPSFLYIIVNVTLPILAIVALGFVLQRKFCMQIRTFTQINLFVFIPAVLFIKIYEASISLAFLGKIAAYVLLLQLAMFLLAEILSRCFRYPRGKRKALGNMLQFFNCGHYGLPVIEMLFPANALAATSQVFIMLIQNIATSTFGVFQASSGRASIGKAALGVLKTPLIYAILLAVAIRMANATIPEPIMAPVRYLGAGYVGVGLLTLGVQLAEIKTRISLKTTLPTAIIRLLVSPAIGALLIWCLGIEGELAKAMIIGVAMPVAVNIVILSQEYDNDPEFVTQNVLVSTLLSPFSLALLVFILNVVG